MSDTLRPFDRRTLESAFERLGELAVETGKLVEISVYGGAALVMTMPFRVSTHDVDAVFENDRAFFRQASKTVAAEFGWQEDWLNDGVKGFLSGKDAQNKSKNLFRTYPADKQVGLRVFVASPSYLFAMKCLAMRVGGVEKSQDVEDIRNLAETLGIRNAAEALHILSSYYSSSRVPPKTRFGIEEIFGQGPTTSAK